MHRLQLSRLIENYKCGFYYFSQRGCSFALSITNGIPCKKTVIKNTKIKLRPLGIPSTNSVATSLRILYLGFGAYYVLPLNTAIIIDHAVYVLTSTRYLDAGVL